MSERSDIAALRAQVEALAAGARVPPGLSREEVETIADERVAEGFEIRAFLSDPIEFELADTIQRTTIVNASVTEDSRIIGTVKRADGMTDATTYQGNPSDIVDGQFNLQIVRAIDPLIIPPELDETVHYQYLVIG